MKIIGRTESGERIFVGSMEEIIALLNAAQALKKFSLCCQVINEATPEMPPAVEPSSAPRPARRKKVGRRPQAAPSEIIGKKRICLWCDKPLPANTRRKTHKGECEMLWKRKQAREWFRKKHNVKTPRKFKDESVLPGVNPASPFLTDAQRNALKAKRLSIIQTLSEKHKHDDAT